jgi:hypothetical protein
MGAQAITDIATAVSGVELGPNTLNALENITVTLGQVTITGGLTDTQLRASAVTIGGTVTVGSIVTHGVTIANSSVTIGGSVTATISGTPSVTFTQASITFGTAVITGSASILNFPATQTVTFTQITTHGVTISNTSVTVNGTFYQATQPVSLTTLPALVAGTAKIGSVTASGTVTAQLNYVSGSAVGLDGGSPDLAGLRLGYNSNASGEFVIVTESTGLPISGTVTANVWGKGIDGFVQLFTANDSGGRTYDGGGAVAVGFNDNINTNFAHVSTDRPFPIQGTVTIGSALPAGTNRIGVVTIGAGTVTIGAGTAQIGSVTASISNFPATQAVSLTTLPALVAGTAQIGSVTVGNTVTIAGTVTANPTGTQTIAGSVTLGASTSQIGSVTASISGTVPISISSVTVGNSVTIGSLPAISGTVTANTFAVQGTVVTTSNFTSTTASTVLANYNATRKVLTIFNEGAGNLHICAGATCTTIAYQVRLSAGDYYEVPNHQTTITHSAVFATAGTARVTQVT